MILNQNESSFTTFLGWYGNCMKECESFDIKSKDVNKAIFSVYQFSDTVRVFIHLVSLTGVSELFY